MGGATAVEDTKAKEEIIEAIFFDGRKDKTRVIMEGSRGILHPRVVWEEHILCDSLAQGSVFSTFHTRAGFEP